MTDYQPCSMSGAFCRKDGYGVKCNKIECEALRCLFGISLSSRPQMNILFTILGLISLGLGILGAFLPGLPTTPLLLLAAALFLRGNRRLYDWLMNHPKLGPYITNFLKHKAIPLRIKVVAISTLWITLLYCAVFVASHWTLRLCFLAIATGVTIHILSYKTLDGKDE